MQDDSSSLGIRPIKQQVVVRQDPVAEHSPGGIVLLEQAQREQQTDVGTVLMVGPLVRDVVPGERVLFKRRPESALNHGQHAPREEWKDVLMLREEDMILVLEP